LKNISISFDGGSVTVLAFDEAPPGYTHRFKIGASKRIPDVVGDSIRCLFVEVEPSLTIADDIGHAGDGCRQDRRSTGE
jgi:hypothetical protein